MKKISLLLSLIIFTLCVVSIQYTLAQSPDNKTTLPPADNTTQLPTKKSPTVLYLQNPLKAKNVEQALTTLVDFAIFIGIILAVFMFIFIGFKFVFAQGNETALKEARKWFFYAVVGTAILISSRVLVEVIQNTATSAGIVNENLFKKQ